MTHPRGVKHLQFSKKYYLNQSNLYRFRIIKWLQILSPSDNNEFLFDLGPVYMEKSCPGHEGHPPSRVNFTERLYQKKVDPSARAKS